MTRIVTEAFSGRGIGVVTVTAVRRALFGFEEGVTRADGALLHASTRQATRRTCCKKIKA